jgi:DNA-binding transcriptional LysR family regulator
MVKKMPKKVTSIPDYRPSLGELAFFKLICDRHRKGNSMESLARECGMSKSRLSTRLLKLELAISPAGTAAESRVILIKRSKAGSMEEVTAAGKQLYEESQKLFAMHGRLPSRLQEKIAEEDPNIAIATTRLAGAHFLPAIIERYQRTFGKNLALKIHFEEDEKVPNAVQDGNAEIGLGLFPPTVRWREYVLGNKPFMESPMCLLCSPTHELAAAFRNGEFQSIHSRDLAPYRLFMISPSNQSGLQWELPPPDTQKGGERIQVDTFEMVFSFVRSGQGIGLVPRWPWVFQDYEQQGQLVSIPVDGLTPLKMALFVPKKESRRTLEVERMIKVVGAFKRHLSDQISLGRRCAELPSSLDPFNYGYYVSCTRSGCTRWRCCTFNWRNAERGEISGDERDIDTPHQFIYDIKGTLDGKLLHFRATGKNGDSGDCYAAAFTSMIDEPASLVGTWTGFDDAGKPASGPFILSRHALDRQTLNDLSHIAQMRMFLNAEQTICEATALAEK